MIRYQQDRTRVIDGLDMLEPIDTHQVVCRYSNPARAKNVLAPGPETLPSSQVHPMGKAKGETFKGREDCQFFGCRLERVSHGYPQTTQIMMSVPPASAGGSKRSLRRFWRIVTWSLILSL